METKYNQVLEGVRPAIDQLTRTRRKLVAAECLLLFVMMGALYFLMS